MLLSPRDSTGGPGWDGLASGVMGAEAGLGAESPTAFVATTVKVYLVPLVSPVTVQVVVGQAWLPPA